MVDTKSNTQIKLIKTFAQSPFGICHYFFNYLIFHSLNLMTITRCHYAIPTCLVESLHFNTSGNFLMRFSGKFLPESKEFLTAFKFFLLIQSFMFPELSELMLIHRCLNPLREIHRLDSIKMFKLRILPIPHIVIIDIDIVFLILNPLIPPLSECRGCLLMGAMMVVPIIVMFSLFSTHNLVFYVHGDKFKFQQKRSNLADDQIFRICYKRFHCFNCVYCLFQVSLSDYILQKFVFDWWLCNLGSNWGAMYSTQGKSSKPSMLGISQIGSLSFWKMKPEWRDRYRVWQICRKELNFVFLIPQFSSNLLLFQTESFLTYLDQIILDLQGYGMWILMVMSFPFLIIKHKSLSETLKLFDFKGQLCQQPIHTVTDNYDYKSKKSQPIFTMLFNSLGIILLTLDFMGNSIASSISTKLYPLIKKNVFPEIDNNLEGSEARKLKKHLTQLFQDMHQAILPIKFAFNIKPGSAIGDYKDKLNMLSFLLSLRVEFQMWVDKGFPDYLKARLSFQTRVGMTEWSTALSVQVQIRCSFW